MDISAHASVKRPSLANLALVGALHLGAGYAFLVALDVVPNPMIRPGPVTLKIVDPHPAKPNPPSSPSAGVTFRRPLVPVAPHAPVIRVQEGASTAPTGFPPTAVEPSGAPLPSHSGLTEPVRSVAATHTIPPYPPLAIRLGYSGSVALRISVDEHGNVLAAEIEKPSGHADLDAAAVAWVKAHWRYEPALQDGNAIPATTTAVVTFRLKQARW